MSSAILLSGGLDSAALAYWKRPQVAITIDYGQIAAAGELRAAGQIARCMRLRHLVLSVPVGRLGTGVMGGRPVRAYAPTPEWWPFRNQLLITIAAMKAVQLGIKRLLIGSVSSDRQHSDGTRRFITAIQKVTRLQEGRLAVEAPAIRLTTAQLLKRSGITPEIVAWTHSCHRAEYACGDCRGCRKRREMLRAVDFPLY